MRDALTELAIIVLALGVPLWLPVVMGEVSAAYDGGRPKSCNVTAAIWGERICSR